MDAADQAPLRYAIIGVGAGILGAHRPSLAMDDIEVVGVTDVNREMGEARAAELGCPFFADHRELLAQTQPDVTVILTPHPFHASLAIDALNAGSHVLTEKPMAVEVAEADAMISAAEANNRIVAISFQQRFRPEVEAAKAIISSGQLGQLQRVTQVEPWIRTKAYYASGGWRGTWRGEGGGVLMNQAPHSLDLVCYLAGMPKRVFAWNRNIHHNIEVEETSQAMLEWENGALGSIFYSTSEAGMRRIEFVGSGGRLRIEEKGGISFERYATDLRDYIPNSPERFAAPPFEEVEIEMGTGKGLHINIYEDLHNAIRTGGKPRADGVESRMSLELANAIIYSSYTNAPVELPLDRGAYSDLLKNLKRGGS